VLDPPNHGFVWTLIVKHLALNLKRTPIDP